MKKITKAEQSKRVVLQILFVLTVVGACLRIAGFPNIPVSVNRDEAALGYNAFSLLRTGMDEWGVTWPITFRSFGDYKLAGYIYALLPSISIFGLNEFTVRLPSLIAGIFLIPATYFFAHSLTRKSGFGLTSAGLVAVAPWSIHYSHVGFEANLALLFFILGLGFILQQHYQQNTTRLIFGAGLVFISLLTYNAPLILVPAVALVLFLYSPRFILPAGILICMTFFAYVLVAPATKGKQAITVFANSGLQLEQQEKQHNAAGNFLLRLTANKFVFFSSEILQRYAATFAPTFLVRRGGENPWHQPQGASHLTWSLYLLAYLGFAGLVAEKPKGMWILFGFLLLSPLPSALTIDAPQATRSLFFLFCLICIGGYAMDILIRKRSFRVPMVAMIVFLVFETVSYMHLYLTEYPRIDPSQSNKWNNGMELALAEAETKRGGKTVTILGDTHYSYIYPLFFHEIHPTEFTSTVQYYPDDPIGLSQVQSFLHYRFVDNDDDIQTPTVVIEEEEGSFSVSDL